MIRSIRFCLMTSILLVSAACSPGGKDITVYPTYVLTVENLVTCSEVIIDDNNMQPVDIRNNFRKGDSIYILLHLIYIDGSHTCSFSWYDSEGKKIRDSGPIYVNPDGGFHYDIYIYDLLRPADIEATVPGEWNIVVFLDGSELDRRSIRINI